MTARPSLLAVALLGLMLAGCQTTGASAPAAEAPVGPGFAKGKANSAALIGGTLLGTPSQEGAAAPVDRTREDALLERWKHDRQFF